MKIIEENSRSFAEFLHLPNLTTKNHTPDKVDLSADLVKFRPGSDDKRLRLKTPLVSAVMQAVSGVTLATALAKEGGISFIFHSQSVKKQAEMVARVKGYKAGFVESTSNLRSDATMAEALELKREKGHSTIAITDDGTSRGVFVGLLGSNDYPPDSFDQNASIMQYATLSENIKKGSLGIDLVEAYKLMWEHKQRVMPILDNSGRLVHLVFRRDYQEQAEKRNQNVDQDGRLIVGAGINTRDYKDRVPALLKAGADVLCIDSSDGYSEWVADTIKWIKGEYGDTVKVGAGNVVDPEAFNYLADAGADFIKVGVGPGSICITRKQKGIGRGQASAVIAVAEARDEYLAKTGSYIPLCADGGISSDYEMIIALALGADFLMLGRYFAGFDESPTEKVLLRGRYFKEYWAEGSTRANNWARYDMGGTSGKLAFEEGVEGYVPYAGPLDQGIEQTLAKIRSTYCNCGVLTNAEMRESARLVTVSPVSLQQGSFHNILAKDEHTDMM